MNVKSARVFKLSLACFLWISLGASLGVVHAKDHPKQRKGRNPAAANLIEAKQRFSEGVQLVEDGNHEAAIVEFEASNRLVPRPNTLYNLGLSYEAIFRYEKALEYYKAYLRQAERDDPDRPSVVKIIKRLKNRLGALNIETTPAAEVWLGDRKLGLAPGKFLVPSGRHVLEIRSEDFIPVRKQIDVLARSTQNIAFKLKPAQITVKETTGISPVWFWTGVGLTVVSAAIGSYFVLRTVSLNDDVKNANPLLPLGEQIEEDRDEAALYADIFLISAGALAIGTLFTAFFTRWTDDDSKPGKDREHARRPTITPWMSFQSAGLELKGEL
ncbi:MAG: PEGA domain-containing protein [Myxococcales bacterium]|nr:MAG: PEGA domain-containing protein [Myxococcales bacterium]